LDIQWVIIIIGYSMSIMKLWFLDLAGINFSLPGLGARGRVWSSNFSQASFILFMIHALFSSSSSSSFFPLFFHEWPSLFTGCYSITHAG